MISWASRSSPSVPYLSHHLFSTSSFPAYLMLPRQRGRSLSFPLYWPVIPVCGAINWNIENLTERGEERRTCKELPLVVEQGNKVIDTDHTSRSPSLSHLSIPSSEEGDTLKRMRCVLEIATSDLSSGNFATAGFSISPQLMSLLEIIM